MSVVRLRHFDSDLIEELNLEEFERRARDGRIRPRDRVCFSVLTGDTFVEARELEMFRGLRATAAFNFRENFTLGRMPWITIALILALVAIWLFWQRPAPQNSADLTRQGAKVPSLMIELGEWWRLLSANLLHVSGWHLAINVLFLFNLGGPVEATFRRMDYLLIVLASALGSNLLSTLANPSVSCGASGVVFGVWGAAAVFGIRYRELLPDRYRRYFIGSVIPYSIVTLYLGFAMSGVDNWGHFGGLVSGAAVASNLPARLLEPQDRWLATKVATVAAVAFALALLSNVTPIEHRPLIPQRLYSRLGLSASVPAGWQLRLAESSPSSVVLAFGNEAEVGFGARIDRLEAPVDPTELVRWFTEQALEEELVLANARGIRVVPKGTRKIGGVNAQRIVTDMLTSNIAARAEHLLFARGHYRYVLSFSAPLAYADAYRPLFENIIASVSLTEPRELDMARREARQQPSPGTQAALVDAMRRAGESAAAARALRDGLARWPGHPELEARIEDASP